MLPISLKRPKPLFQRHAKKPTSKCLCLILLCVCFLVNERSSLTEDESGDLNRSVDDVTDFHWKCLLTALTTGSLRIGWSLLSRTVVVRFLKCYRQHKKLRFAFAVVNTLIISGLYIGLLTLFLSFLWRPFANRVKDSIVFVEITDTITMSYTYTIPFNVNTKDPHWQICLETRQRYKSEDVRIECKMEFQLPDLGISHSLKTIHVSSPNSNRKLTSWGNEQSVDFQPEITPKSKLAYITRYTQYYIKVTLFLQRLTEEDFGTYTWNSVVEVDFPVPHMYQTSIPLPVQYRTLKWVFTVAKFTIQKCPPTVKEVYIPPGGIVHLVTSHWMEDYNKEEILVEHRFNGQPLDGVLNGEEDLCAISVLSYSRRIDQHLVTKRKESFEHAQYYKHFSKDPVVHDVGSFCVHPAMYGVLTTHVRRVFYNQETQREDFVEGQYPLIVKLAPSYPGFFGSVSEHADTAFFDECWKDNQPAELQNCSTRSQETVPQLNVHFGIYNIEFGLAFFIAPYLTVWSIVFVVKRNLQFFFDGSFNTPVLDTLVSVTVDWNVFSRHRPKRAAHDVFFSYDPDDSEIAQSVRIHFRACGLRVFDCHDSPGPGEATLLSWDRAIDESTGFVILASRRYVANPEMCLQFRSIHYRMLSWEIPEERMLIISTDNCDIPRTLGPLPIIPYYGGLTARRQLVWWIMCLTRCHSEGSALPRYSTLWREALHNLGRDYRHLCLFLQNTHMQCRYVLRETITGNLRNVCPLLFRRSRNSQHLLCQQQSAGTSGGEHSASSSESQAVMASTTSTDATKTQILSIESCEPSRGPCDQTNTDCFSSSDSSEETRCTLGGPGFEHSGGAAIYDVFLTYCEDSQSDRSRAEKVKVVLEQLGLQVFDAVCGVLAYEVEQEAIASAVSRSASFVVLLSLAFRSHPLTQRLHFPQVLHAVETGRVSVDHVLIIRTGYKTDTAPKNTDQTLTLSISPQATETHARITYPEDLTNKNLGGTARFNHANSEHTITTPTCENPKRDRTIQEHVASSSGASVLPSVVSTENRDCDIQDDFCEDHGEEYFHLHEGLHAFEILAWTGGLADEDYLRQVILWGRAVLRQRRRQRRADVEELQRQYLAERLPRQHVMTLSKSFRFL